MKTSRENAVFKQKHGINIWVYPAISSAAGLVYIEVKEGHLQEFYDEKSTFTYYIIEGDGTFYINGKPLTAIKGDLIKIPPKNKIYYLGTMKMLLITTPAWKEENEVHVRFINRREVEPMELNKPSGE